MQPCNVNIQLHRQTDHNENTSVIAKTFQSACYLCFKKNISNKISATLDTKILPTLLLLLFFLFKQLISLEVTR